MADDIPFRFFDAEADVSVIHRDLPHWAQSGTMCFITWRTWDSLPRKVLEGLLAEQQQWLAKHGINHDSTGKERLARLPFQERLEFRKIVAERWEAALDHCQGECVLRRPELAEIVAKSLQHFDGDRYTLSDFVIMPNHVHLLAVFPDEDEMLKQCESWKHFTATRINRVLNRGGRFWEVDGFDHLVRSAEQFDYLRRYIADNPRKAGLKDGEYRHYAR